MSHQESQIDALFRKIDCASQGAITWDEFCTYMQLEYAEIEDSYKRARQVGFQLPANSRPMPHREPVLRVVDTSEGSFIACSHDGLMTFWSASMTLKRTKSIIVSIAKVAFVLYPNQTLSPAPRFRRNENNEDELIVPEISLQFIKLKVNESILITDIAIVNRVAFEGT